LKPDYGARHSLGNPIQLYPLYENGFRAYRNQSIADNHAESSQLYAEFAQVAEKNKYAWNYPAKAETKESIGTVSKRNRMICFPCKLSSSVLRELQDADGTTDPLLMNAFNTVNLSAACILTSTEHAKELGVPRSKWIYPLGGAGTEESNDSTLMRRRK
jgi:hypothetical protein